MSKPDEQQLAKGTYRMTREEQLAAVPKIFRPYWETLARKNTYYNHQFMLEWAQGLQAELVLDAGCGDNSTLRVMNPPMTRVVGMDPFLPDLKKNPVPAHKALSVLETLPFADRSFAAVYCDSVFEHIEDPRLVCGEIYRVAQPGAKVLINTNSVFNPFMFPNKFMTIRQREWVKTKFKIISEGTYRAPYRINTRRRMTKYLREAGFVNIQIYRWGLPAIYRPRWLLVPQLLMELVAETPLFCGLKHRLMATCGKPRE
jgi:ubiquinone/menaquinone biosynthesis C-methylase UbiE